MGAWPEYYHVDVGIDGPLALPLVRDESGFGIYALDLMGQTGKNEQIAGSLRARLAGYDFDLVVTAEAKAIGLAQEFARQIGHPEYVVMRKGAKLYMHNPVSVEVKSITTSALQRFYLGQHSLDLMRGRRVCILDDVLSTGGTLRAMLQMAAIAECEVVVAAMVLTEEIPWTEFEGVPVVSLGHIPLPAMSQEMG